MAPRAPSGRHFGRHNREAAPKGRPWAPCWAPWCPSGARGRHLGTDSAANFSFREIRVFTPYISFLTPPNLPPSSPRSKIPSSLRVFIIFSQSPLESTSFYSKSLIIPLFYYHFYSISTTHRLQPPSSSMAAPLDEFGLSSTMSG